MKWRIAAIVVSYTAGAAFLGAWYFEARKIWRPVPGANFNINPIMWMWNTGLIFISIGVSLSLYLVALGIVAFILRKIGKSA